MRSFRHPRWQHLDYRVKVATTQENKPPTQGTRQWTFTTPRWRCGSILLPSLNAGVPEPTGGANMKWIRRVLLKIQRGHNSVHRRTRWNSISPFQLRWSRGYNEILWEQSVINSRHPCPYWAGGWPVWGRGEGCHENVGTTTQRWSAACNGVLEEIVQGPWLVKYQECGWKIIQYW